MKATFFITPLTKTILYLPLIHDLLRMFKEFCNDSFSYFFTFYENTYCRR